MNERIKELAEQASEYASKRDMTGEYVIAFDQDKYSKKFAELIVRECNSKLDNIGVIDRDSRTIAMKVISEHFGVE